MRALKNNFYQKILATAILFVLLTNLIIGGILLPHRTAQAVFADYIGGPSNVVNYILQGLKWSWEKVASAYHSAADWISANLALAKWADTWYMRALKYAWTVLKKKLLDMLVDDIVKWIQGGGKPRVVTNWQGFLMSAVDQAGGQFIEKYLGMGFLCDTFDLQLRIALARVPTFDTRVRCPVSMMAANVTRFFDNFASGGWKSWIQISEPSNNIYGAYLLALDEKIGIQSAAKEAAQNEAVASAGFLGDKICRTIYPLDNPQISTNGTWKQNEIPENFKCSKWEVRTPGKIAAEALTKGVLKDIDWLIASKDWNEYIGAIIDATINRAIKEGITYLTTPSGGSAGQTGPGIDSNPYVTADLTAYEDATQNVGQAAALADQQRLLMENLQGVLAEYSVNLTILYQIRDIQINTLNVLGQLIALGCPVPSGVTQINLGTQAIGFCDGFTCPCDMTTVTQTRLVAPGIGELITEKITEWRYREGYGDAEEDCVANITTSTQIISAATTVEQEIDRVISAMVYTQDRINDTQTAINDVIAYQQKATDYINAYEALQRGTGTQETVDAAETTMWSAKNQAITSSQIPINSSSVAFSVLTQETQQTSMSVVQETGDLQMRRGAIQSCDFAMAGTYYRDLCNTRTTYNNYSNQLITCQQQSEAGGG